MPRLVIVSNRLPLTSKPRGDSVEFLPSSGGLVTAVAAHLEHQRARDPEFDSLWVGWPGSEIAPDLEEQVRSELAKHHASPVFLSEEDSNDFYYGFCNRTLWPLFHYFSSFVDYDPKTWQTYVHVNRVFCDALAALLRPGDTVWIHDYQLLLLPAMLRERYPETSIGFFLHTPFPSFELFRMLPRAWKEQLLEGMLGADLIGFHVHEYTQHFLQCALRVLGCEHQLGRIIQGDQIRRADTFPLGVAVEAFERTSESEAVIARSQQIAGELRGARIILSVDRLDYTKGLLERLRGYAQFLETHPDWHGKVAFVLLVVPSRIEVPRYRALKEELDEQIGKLNGRFGRIDWTPVVYQYHAVSFDELVALYRAANVALITPLRDGMNLVAKEYLASKPDGTGVLILSELAGAARELGEAILINPNHADEIARALARALEMPHEEQLRRNQPLRERLRRNDASGWAKQFLECLGRVKSRQGKLATKQLSPAVEEQVVKEHRTAQRALLLLDYDGTLVPIAARPELAAPDPELFELLGALCAHPSNTVYLISGRERTSLARWFGHLDVGIIAEHGAWLCEPRGVFDVTRPLGAEWKDQVHSILRVFAEQVAGSFVEVKDFALAWHYRAADLDLGEQRAKELIDELTQYTANLPIQIIEGKKVVEVRTAGVSKGTAALDVLARLQPGFTLAVGDDHTDEDLFRALPASATSIHVGSPFSNARYRVRDHRHVRALLARLAERG